jgi:hypothetical protein
LGRVYRRAKIVVVPLLPSTMYAPGLSLYLMAMAMKKCVIVTEGLATRGMLKDEAVIVAPKDPEALAVAAHRVYGPMMPCVVRERQNLGGVMPSVVAESPAFFQMLFAFVASSACLPCTHTSSELSP